MRNKWLLRALGLVTLLSGCDVPCASHGCIFAPDPPNTTLALDLVWRQVYGENGDHPPIFWVAVGDCSDQTKFWVPSAEKCLVGDYLAVAGFEKIWVMLDSNPKIQWKTYAHELMHAHLFRMYDNGDPGHQRDEWGEVFSLAQKEMQIKQVF